MRLFFAIELPGSVRQRLAEIAHPPLNALKWVSAEQLHVTLKFLGPIADADLPRLLSAADAVVRPRPLELRVEGVSLFPERGPVRIVAASVAEASGTLAKLVADLEAAAEPLGVPRENRPFHAHVTLARAKPPVRRDRVIVTVPAMSFTVGEFVLMESRLSPKGSTYTVAARYPLL
jgi:2'-5' RNA ligase